jgi:major membrane immunogen (membrane-anchored lipoprotein)
MTRLEYGILAVIAIIVILALLGSCQPASNGYQSSTHRVTHKAFSTPFGFGNLITIEVTTLDGRIVTCVESSDALDCDFEHTRSASPEAEKIP